MGADRDVARLALGQHGLVALEQLRELGLGRHQVHHRVVSGRLEPLEPRLFRVAGAPETREQRVLGACLSVGRPAVACRRTAAALWDLWTGPEPPIEIAVPRPRSPQWVAARVHRSTDIVRGHRSELEGIPVTTVPRTLVDLGAVAAEWHVEDAVDRALVRELATIRELEHILDDVARQGRRGVGPLRRSLADMTDGLESVLEAKLLRIIRRSTLPEPDIQHRVPLGPGDSARIDLAYPELKIAIEADGREAHTSRDAFDRDRRRQHALERMGWRVLRFTWSDVTQRPSYVVAEIRHWIRRRSDPSRPRS